MHFLDRVRKLQGEVSGAGLVGAIVTSTENVRYLAGYRGFTRLPRAVAIPVSGDPVLVIAQGDEALARFLSPFAVRTYPLSVDAFRAMDAFRSMIESCASWLKGAGIFTGLIGLELGSLTVDQYRSCEGVISGHEFSDITGRITELRTIKDGDEQTELRHASELAVTAAKRAVGEFRPGATESLIKSVMEQTALVEGGRMWPDAAIETDINVVSGPKMKRPHDFATGRVVGAGEAALFFEAIACNGYWANLARTVIIPGASRPAQQEMLEVIDAAHRAALDCIGPGLTLRRAGRAADEILAKHGLHESTPMFRGLGLTFYERPGLGDLDNPLKPGMSLSVNLYVNPGGETLGRSDTVLITEKVAEVLTASMS